MTRPTPEREATTSPFARPGTSAEHPVPDRDRTGHGGHTRPAVAAPASSSGSSGSGAPAAPTVSDVRPAAPAQPVRMSLVAVGDDHDTPGADPAHLIEVVGTEAAPLWHAYLPDRARRPRERLIEHYEPLVRGVGSKLAIRLPPSIELADLVQSGAFGLMEAVDRFDPFRAVPFDGYAAQRVRGAMLDELRAQDWIPRTIRARSREVERARDVLALRTGRAPTDRELATELGIGLRELRQATRPVHLVSAEVVELASGSAAVRAAEQVADDVAPDPALEAVRRETERELCAAVGQLGDRDRTVLRMYYLEGRTLAEIGRLLGVTESRVCQLHSRLVSRLRGRMESTLAG